MVCRYQEGVLRRMHMILLTGLLGYGIQLKPGLEATAGTILGMGLAMVRKQAHKKSPT